MSENFTSLFLELCKKVAAMQDKVDDLESKNDDLESKNEAMQDELDDLKSKVEILMNPPTPGENTCAPSYGCHMVPWFLASFFFLASENILADTHSFLRISSVIMVTTPVTM